MPNGMATTTTNSGASVRTDLYAELAAVGEGIVSRLTSVLNHKIGVTNVSGNIVADSDLSNFDKFIPAAITAIQKGNTVTLPAGEVDQMSGWVIPLRHQDRILGTLIIRNDPSPSDDVIPLAKSLSELLLYQMLVMDRVAQENRILDKFFYDLFENQQPQEKLMRDSLFFNSQFFRIDFSENRVVAVLILKDLWNDIFKNQPILPADQHKLTMVKDQIAELAENTLNAKQPIIAYLGQDEFAMLLPYPTREKIERDKKQASPKLFPEESLVKFTEEAAKKFNRDVYLGLGQFYPEISGLIRSYQGARKAARLGLKLNPTQKVYHYTDLLLPVLLEQADKELQKQFVENELGSLTHYPELIETLSTHFDSNLNLKKTAYELGIHKNTLYYRLAKIKKILDVDAQEFNQAIRLKIALYLWQILKENGEMEG